MLDVNNCGTSLQGGQGRTCAAEEVGVGRAWADAGKDDSPTNIMHAAYVGALERIKSMVARGAAPDAADVLRGSTPLHWASFGGHLDVVRWLVRTAGAEADRPNNDGCTPLLFACEGGHMGVAQWLVREGGAKVNVRDNVMWQTPLHRVFLSAQRATHGANVNDVEELVLWLVESGADLTSVDRFGNHVEDTRTVNGQGGLMSPSHSKLCDMIVLARQERTPDEGARENLRRRSSVQRKSTGDLVVQLQLSPKLEAKQRAPISRRGSRKGSNGISRGGSSSDSSSPPGSQVGIDTGSYDNKAQGGNKQYQRRTSCGRVVSKTTSNDSEEAELFSVSPASTHEGNGGNGGGLAAVALGVGAKMGGGSAAPAVASQGVQEREGNGEGGAAFVDEMAAIVGSAEGAQREQRVQSTGFEGHVMAAEEKRRLDGAGQILIERIRELATKKSAGAISQKTFLAKKRQLLEMEFLRRELDEETRRRAQGYADDEGTGILTSVGQNTPPPSPKAAAEDHGFAADDDDKERVPTVITDAEKYQRESYKASDIDRYTTIKTEGPRVFGEVPDSVKQSLAAKEALRDATAGLRQDGGEGGWVEKDRGKRGKAKRSDYPLSPSKNKHIRHDDYSGATADGGRAVDSEGVQEDSRDRSKSPHGCICVIM